MMSGHTRYIFSGTYMRNLLTKYIGYSKGKLGNEMVLRIKYIMIRQQKCIRGVARGGAEGARAPPEFGRSVNPIQTRGGRLCPPHYCQPPRIQKAIYTSAKLY